MAKGVYQLLIYLPKNASIVIGKRGRFRFPKGYYIYTGSARNGLGKRVERHLKKNKKHFWHIDYLLDFASVKKVFLFTNGKFDECGLNLKTLEKPNAKIVMPKFGSSDCGCPAHLVFFEKMPTNELICGSKFTLRSSLRGWEPRLRGSSYRQDTSHCSLEPNRAGRALSPPHSAAFSEISPTL